MTTVVNEINETVTVKSQSNDNKKGKLTLQISNNASNTTLLIDSIEICNILVTDKTSGTPKKGKATILRSIETTQLNFGDKILTPETGLPEQKFTPWSPDTLPQNTNNMYITIHGQLYTYIADNSPFLLYSGKMYCSFTGGIIPQNTINYELKLYDNCPIYYETNGTMEKVLKSISFNITIDEWEE